MNDRHDTVLIVDDSLTVRMDLAEALAEQGIPTRGCETLAEARAALGDASAGLVILDVHLPDGDGVLLAQEIRASPRGSEIPILLLSTAADVRDRIRGLAIGSDDYVGKPYDRDYVVARVQELLEGRRNGAADAPAILVIDDSATYREALSAALVKHGYRVLGAASGEEGLRTAASQRPAAVIVDGVLPGIDGPTVVRKMRLDAALRQTPCLLLTGCTTDRSAELQALDAGADAFVRKDEDVDIVLARVAALLRAVDESGRTPLTASLLGPKKILAVDDSLTYLEELGDVLRGEGYDVIAARSGEEALDMLAAQPVDCILLDLVMPGLGGTDTCQRIKASPATRDIPLIMLTAMEERAAMITALSTGADDYVLKSSETDVLKARVRAQLRRKQIEDESRRIRLELMRKELEAAEARAAKELAQTRAALAEELEFRNKELEAFSYSVSHDLRAPLRAIDGFSRILLSDYQAQLDEEGRDSLRRVCDAVRHMGALIDDLLDLSRVTRAEVNRRTVDLSALAQEVAEALRSGDRERRVAFTAQPGLSAQCDARLVRIVLENLLGNAWKFTALCGAPSIEFGSDSQAGCDAYFVRDNGAGFSMEYADMLFKAFHRLHTAEEFPGTGIGLATVQRIIHKHRGRVWAQSAVDHGATFFFTLQGEGER